MMKDILFLLPFVFGLGFGCCYLLNFNKDVSYSEFKQSMSMLMMDIKASGDEKLYKDLDDYFNKRNSQMKDDPGYLKALKEMQ